MEGSTSKTSNWGRSPSDGSDPSEDSIVQSFQNLGFRDVERGAAGDTNSGRIENRVPRHSSIQERWLLENGGPHQDSIWGCRLFVVGRENNWSSAQSSVSNTYNVPSAHSNHVYFPNQDSSEADPAIKWAPLLYVLNGPHSEQKERMIYELQGSIVKLMTDREMHPVFEAFLDSCKMKHFDSLLSMGWGEIDSFVKAAFCSQGVISIMKIMRKLKKTYLAFTMTQILSTKFVDIMTDHCARQAIQTCFILFSHEQNEILYEKTIKNCHCLAVHKVGCRSVNDCIGLISGEQRSRLLDRIADIANILCDDPYGNYVLQNVLKRNYLDVSSRIFERLRGHFVQLAQSKIGSHTVEKCMEIYETWLLSVVEEILNTKEGPQTLAQDPFGNYVIQKALRMTKKQGLVNLYNSLVHALKPHFAALKRTTGGRNVVAVIKEGSLE